MDADKTTCPVCCATLLTKNLGRHMRKVHASSNTRNLSSEPGVAVSHERVLYRCKQCKKLFGKAVAAKHLKDRHGFESKDPENCHRYYFDESVRSVAPLSSASQDRRTAGRQQVDATRKTSLKLLEQASEKVRRHRQRWHRDNNLRDQAGSKEEWRGRLGKSLFHCDICSKDIAFRNIDRHYKKAHQWNIKKSAELDRTSREAMAGGSVDVDEGRASENDYFNTYRVVSAGAFGMGKKR